MLRGFATGMIIETGAHGKGTISTGATPQVLDKDGVPLIPSTKPGEKEKEDGHGS